MKYLVTSVTIGACLLLSSAGDVFAQTNNPHAGAPVAGMGGRLGTGGNYGLAACNPEPSPPGQAMNPNTKSPFPTSPSGPNPGSAAGKYNVDSQYDNACLRQMLHQLP